MRWSAFCASMVAVVALAGCSDSPPEGAGDTSIEVKNSRLVNYEGYAAEFRERGAELEMPDGVDFPQDPPMGPESSGSWEKGTGSSDAVLEWNCAWGRAALAADDAQAKEHALDMFISMEKTAEWDNVFDDHGRTIMRDAVSAARLGDESRFTSIVTAGCPEAGQ